jgi:hypothetical protein
MRETLKDSFHQPPPLITIPEKDLAWLKEPLLSIRLSQNVELVNQKISL